VVGGKPYDGTKVDVWSIGVTLYTMLFGELPFDEDNPNTMYKYIKEAKYYINGLFSYQVKDIINRMLQPNSLKRISISEIIEHPWFQSGMQKYISLKTIHPKIYINLAGIDEQILDELFRLKLNLKHEDKDKVIEAIIKDGQYDF
jgi:5'-AMP-activated protein kinase catalytic alpha subunit